ncbi:MAG: M4 family metallopeptidase [Lentisphaerae bacterium]|nr:M4 family metallopeptidase [Lentisphaerota bacterium]
MKRVLSVATPFARFAATRRAAIGLLTLCLAIATQAADPAIVRDRATGIPTLIRGHNLGQAARVRSKPTSAPDDAVAVLRNLAPLFSMRDADTELLLQETQTDATGRRHVRLRQQHAQLPLIGADLFVHFDRQGAAYQVNGRYLPALDLPDRPLIAADRALALAQILHASAGRPAGARPESAPELVIYALNTSPRLAYGVTLRYRHPALGVWQYYLDAMTGDLITFYDRVRRSAADISGWLLENEGGAEVTVKGRFNTHYQYYQLADDRYDVFNEDTSQSYPDSQAVAWRDTPYWGAARHPDRIQISAAYNIQVCLDYWRQVFDRSSYDGRGSMVRIEVLCDYSTDNAFWWNGFITFCVITDPFLTDLAVLDITGHEFAHGVNESVSGFIYRDESGALDESYADIFGTALEFHRQPDGRAQPYSDNGGVHINNGVQNFMFYLLADGGQGTNDGVIVYNVEGIGISNAVQLAYQSLFYLGPGATYSNAAQAWTAAALDLNTNWLENVRAAWDAVGLGGVPPPLPTGPQIMANNHQTDEAIVIYPAATTITVALTPENLHYGIPADWWIVGLDHRAQQWYYFDELMQWQTCSGNFAECRPAYMGAVGNLPATTVLHQVLPRGRYTFWFGLDTPMDARLDLDNPDILSRSVTVEVQ